MLHVRCLRLYILHLTFVSDAGAARSLTVPMGVTGAMTPQKCLDACRASGYTYAGTEYSAVSILLPLHPSYRPLHPI